MRYVLAVKQAVYGTQGAFLAYQLAQTLIQSGHEISQVFFFQSGVSNGNGFVHPASDEFHLQKLGNNLRNNTIFRCIYALRRRNVVAWWMRRLQQICSSIIWRRALCWRGWANLVQQCCRRIGCLLYDKNCLCFSPFASW